MCVFSRVRLFAAPWAEARQAPLSVEFSRQEYWGGWPFPTPAITSHLSGSGGLRHLSQTSGFGARTAFGEGSTAVELSWQISALAQITDDLSVD